jgi:hydrogenase maturation protease
VRILALGLGNDLYGDDGVGLHAVRLLRNAWTAGAQPAGTHDEVDFVECPVSGVALLDVIHGYDALMIIDTIIKDDPVTGRIRLLETTDVRNVPGPSPHYVSIPQTLAMGKLLGLKMPVTVKIVAVEAKNLFRLGEGLSKDMKARLPEILDAASNVLRGLMQTH